MNDLKKEAEVKNLKEIVSLTKLALENEKKKEEWEGVRTGFGIYTEGKKGTYMIRPRFLESKITPDNMKFLLRQARKYGDGRLHLTTRQDLQLHGIKREDIAEVLEKISRKGFFTKSTGGNGARAVIIPPTSGFEEEVFDVTVHGRIITDYILEGQGFMNLPRKYKISLSNKEENSLYSKINDLGFQAVIRKGRRGFRVYGGGGLGPISREGIVLKEFIEEDEILYQVEAIKNLFSEHGNRKIKSRARLRYVLINLGEKEFLKLYRKYLKKVYEEKGDLLKKRVRKILDDRNQKKSIQTGKKKETGIKGLSSDSNIIKEEKSGNYGYYIRPPKGNIYTKEGNRIMNFIKKLDYEVELKLTSDQKILVRNLKAEDLIKLKKITGKYYSGSEFFNSYSCIGRTTCNLGILDTPVILDYILEHFNNKKELAEYIPKISLSGCPNSCAAHQIAKMGFSGKKKKDGDYFTIYARGEFKGKTVKLNEEVGEIKAEKIPYFLEELAEILKQENKKYEQYMQEEKFIELIKKYSEGVI